MQSRRASVADRENGMPARASRIGSHAGAWEPEKRDAGASRIGSHAGAWEPEKTEITFCNIYPQTVSIQYE
jgi:hypothetical protein